MRAFVHLTIVLVAVVAGLLFGPNGDVVRVGSFEKGGPKRAVGGALDGPGWTRKDVFFRTADDTRCHGWLFRPVGVAPDTKLPVILMASGLAAQIDFGMDTYGHEFAKAGFAVLLFDYRGFGSSDGAVRNLVNPKLHLQDWRAAVEFLAADQDALGVDPNKLALWGSSMSGGHVLVLASELCDPATTPPGVTLRAVSSQSPHLDGRENRKKNMLPPPEGRGILGALRITRAGLADLARSALGMAPAYIPVVGGAGSVSLMPISAEEYTNYFRKHPEPALKGGGWQNMAPARIAMLVGFYNPIDFVDKVTVPTLFLAADDDALCPSELVELAQAMCGGKTELLVLSGGHFEMYFDKNFKIASGAMIKHFNTHLK